MFQVENILLTRFKKILKIKQKCIRQSHKLCPPPSNHDFKFGHLGPDSSSELLPQERQHEQSKRLIWRLFPLNMMSKQSEQSYSERMVKVPVQSFETGGSIVMEKHRVSGKREWTVCVRVHVHDQAISRGHLYNSAETSIIKPL